MTSEIHPNVISPAPLSHPRSCVLTAEDTVRQRGGGQGANGQSLLCILLVTLRSLYSKILKL